MKIKSKYKWYWILVVLLIVNFLMSTTVMFVTFRLYTLLRYGVLLNKNLEIWVKFETFYYNFRWYVQPFFWAAIMGTSLKILYDILKKLDIENQFRQSTQSCFSLMNVVFLNKKTRDVRWKDEFLFHSISNRSSPSLKSGRIKFCDQSQANIGF